MFKIEDLNWTEWKSFPDPQKGENLTAPFGYGIYQLKNRRTKEFVIFGKGNNCAHRMSSLLPRPIGASGRNAEDKKENVQENLPDIDYRTVFFLDEAEMQKMEKLIKALNIHKFNR